MQRLSPFFFFRATQGIGFLATKTFFFLTFTKQRSKKKPQMNEKKILQFAKETTRMNENDTTTKTKDIAATIEIVNEISFTLSGPVLVWHKTKKERIVFRITNKHSHFMLLFFLLLKNDKIMEVET